MGNEATGSPRSRVASRASPQQFLTKGFKDQAKAEGSGEVYEVLTVKKRLEATHAQGWHFLLKKSLQSFPTAYQGAESQQPVTGQGNT